MPPKRKRADNEEEQAAVVPMKVDAPPPKKARVLNFPVFKNIQDYVARYKALTDFESKEQLQFEITAEENKYRELFAQDRDNDLLTDPNLLLIAAHENEDVFKIEQLSPEEEQEPKVFASDKPPVGHLAINDRKEFNRCLNVFTEGLLRDLDWNNVFVAGGSVLACLLPVPAKYASSNAGIRHYYHNVAYKSSDIDIFIYGLDEEEGTKKLEQVFQTISDTNPYESIAFRSKHAITLVSRYPYRHVQIVLRLYKSPAEILMGFDVDCCAIGYNGKNVMMVPRAHRAIVRRINTVDMSRRSPSYEMRLAKYSERGFCVAVPSLNRGRVNPQIFERKFENVNGLAKLLLLEKLSTPEARTRFKEQQRLEKLRPGRFELRGEYWQRLNRQFESDAWQKERMEQEGGANASDYSCVFLPWGPRWDAERIRKLMYSKDLILNSPWYDPNKKIHTHPCFFGTIGEVIKDCCGSCPPNPEAEKDVDWPFVDGDLKWITLDPGRQSIGSFHPITEGDWSEGTYFQPDTEQLCIAVNSNNINTVKAILAQGTDVEARDPVGRTPLHIAVYANAKECVGLLLNAGAKISSRLNDGRTPLHLAAQYGREDIINLLVEHGKKLPAKKDEPAAAAAGGKKGKAPKKKSNKMEEDDEDGDGEDEEDEDKMEEDEDGGDGEDDEGEGDDDEGDGEDGEGFFKKQKEVKEKPKGPDEEKFDVNFEDWDNKMTALHYAVYFGWTKIMEVLIANGANLTAINHQNHNDGLSTCTIPILSLAVLGKRLDAAKLLLKHGAKVEDLNLQHENALHNACRNPDTMEFVELFVEHIDKTASKAKKDIINKVSQSQQTPLVIALQQSPKAAEYLLVNDADAQLENVRDVWGNVMQNVQQPINVAAQAVSDPDLMEELCSKKIDHDYIYGNNTPLDVILGRLDSASHNLESNMRRLEDNDEVVHNTEQLDENIQKAKDAFTKWVYEQKKKEYTKNHGKNAKKQKSADEIARIKEQMETQKTDLKNLIACIKVLQSYKAHELQDMKITAKHPAKWAFDQRKQHPPAAASTRIRRAEDLLKGKLPPKESAAATGIKKAVKSAFGFGAKKVAKKFGAKDDVVELTYNSMKERNEFTEDPDGYHYAYRWRGTQYPDEVQDDYHKLFTAAWEGDLKTIKKLTVDRDGPKQVHICSVLADTNQSPLHLALERGHYDCVAEMIEIAKKQYTPLPEPKKGNQPSLVNANYQLNNYNLVNQFPINPLTGVDVSQYDPNELAKMKFICTTSPATLLKFSNEKGYNLLQAAVLLDDSKGLEVVVDKVLTTDNHKKKPKRVGKKEEAAEQVPLIESLMRAKISNGNLNAFELAIAHGKIDAAKVILRQGGLYDPVEAELKQKEEEQKAKQSDDYYHGLNVGGKKVNWALELQPKAQKPKIPRVSAIHYAAYFNQPASIEFLLKEAEPIWDEYLKKNNIVKLNKDRYFTTVIVDEDDRTPIHYATSRNSAKALRTLLASKESFDIVNNKTKRGETALHMAAKNGYLECLTLLLAAKADITIKDKERGWNALHFVTSSGNAQCLGLILKVCDQQIKDSVSEHFKITPLSIATHSNYVEIVKILLEASATTTIADSSGDFPLHMSAKKGHLEIFNELVNKMEATVHIGMKTQVMNKENHNGLTPLDGVMAALLKTIREQHVPAKQTLEIYTRLLELSSKYPRKIVRVEEVQEGTEVMVKLANKAKKAAEADDNAWEYEEGSYYGNRRRNKNQDFDPWNSAVEYIELRNLRNFHFDDDSDEESDD